MQQHMSYSTREAAQLVGVDPTTIQRAIIRGELEADRRGTAKRARYQIARETLAEWAAANDLAFVTPNGHVDPSTGEVLEAPAAAEVAPAAVQRLGRDFVREPISNVGAVMVPPAASVAADRLALLAQLVKAGQFEAAQLVIGVWAL